MTEALDRFPHLSVVVLAKNEQDTIAACLTNVFAQLTDLKERFFVEVIVVANGCSDNTVSHAHDVLLQIPPDSRIKFSIYELTQGGKSRSWNAAIHKLTSKTSAYHIFLDSDISVISNDTLHEMLSFLEKNPDVEVYVGYPVKLIEANHKKSLLDLFSLLVSRTTRHKNAINGSLYIARSSVLRKIWLPNETPGEDGFLNAMVCTDGFSKSEQIRRVVQCENYTHYFKEHAAYQFFSHECRMIVGTMINRWIFEYLWSLHLRQHAGEIICALNRDDPEWVQRLIDLNVRGLRWPVSLSLILRRFGRPGRIGWTKFLLRFPIALAATILSAPSVIMANSILRRKGASSHW